MSDDERDIDEVSGDVIGAAVEVHKQLGPGLLERAYQEALEIELAERGLDVATELDVPVRYRGRDLDTSYRLDLVVEGSIVVEVKAVTEIESVHRAQMLTYLSFAEAPLGLLINFHSPRLVDGVHRMAL